MDSKPWLPRTLGAEIAAEPEAEGAAEPEDKVSAESEADENRPP